MPEAVKRRWPKPAFAAICLAAWLTVAALGLELHARYTLRRDAQEAERFCAARMDAAFAADYTLIAQTAATAPRPPEDLVRPLPPREDFGVLDDAARGTLARERRELILLFDATRRVEKIYLPETGGELGALSRAVQPGQHVSDILSGAEAADALAVWPRLAPGVFEPPHEYTVRLPDGAAYASEWSFLSLAGPRPAVAAFIRDSMWQVTWTRFRGHVYGNNFYDRWLNSEFWTNAQGYRDDEVVLPKPPGVVRIVCIGGSTTVEGPRNDLTYPNLLESKLRAHFKTDRIEVVNCGVYTLDSGREALCFPDYLALEPDLIIEYNFINDIAANLAQWMRPESLRGDPVKNLKQWLRQSVFVHRHFNAMLLPPERELRRRYEDTFFRNHRQMLEQARAAGVAMAFGSFAHPDVDRLDPRETDYFYLRSNRLWGWSVDTRSYVRLVGLYNEMLRAFCARHDVPYLPIAEHVTGGVESFTDICHMHLNAMDDKAGVAFEHLRDFVAERLAAAGPARGTAP
ncbi:MAG: SGNH/GDSL hydrolase family protein [Candidatus Hydrogenedentes bacterium]|nr:SGNH/GDSL hydrolase family protein [Candidatus Hydrogenedentota bacterium]